MAALIVEPVQGKGVWAAPPGFLAEAADLLHANGGLLICDEVQTGIGRTGELYAFQHDNVQPDIVTVAKALSGGYIPIGAMITTESVFGSVYSSMDKLMVHDSTFGGNAQAMAVGLATLAVLEEEKLVENAATLGDQLRERLAALVGEYEMLEEVRGRGLMIGIQFGRPRSLMLRTTWSALQRARVGLFAQMVVAGLYHHHRILTQVSGDHLEVIKLIPPLNITQREVDTFVDAFAAVMDEAHRGRGLMWDFGRVLIKGAVSN